MAILRGEVDSAELMYRSIHSTESLPDMPLPSLSYVLTETFEGKSAASAVAGAVKLCLRSSDGQQVF